MHAPEILETPRLRLRPPALDDAEHVFKAYARDAEVTRYLLWRPHAHVDSVRQFLASHLAARAEGRVVSWMLTAPGEPGVLGMVELRPDGHRVEMGYVLARAYWGRGLMTEAVRTVVETALAQPDVYRVWAVCDVDNAASARVLEKAGLEREGRLCRWSVHPNVGPEPRDSWCYARVK